MNKLLLKLVLLTICLQSCNDSIEPKIQNNTKNPPVISITANIDPIYEYDGEGLRAAQFTAEDAPRIKLTSEEFNDFAEGSSKNLDATTTYRYTNLQLHWLAYRDDNTLVGNAPLTVYNQISLFPGDAFYVKVEENNGNYRLNTFVSFTDALDIKPINDATWFAVMYLGGKSGVIPGGQKEDYLRQYFSKTRRIRITGKEYQDRPYISTDPNHLIYEQDGTSADISRRHFPLIGNLTKIDLRYDPNSPFGNYDNKGNNAGHIDMELKPRGTIFTITLDNQTNKNIEVTDIEVPISGTRGDAFYFEGYFRSEFKPFINGKIDSEGCIPSFYKYYESDVFGKIKYTDTLSFPLYRRGGEKNIIMSSGAQSGRLMLWTYVNKPNVPFTARVKYIHNGKKYTSKAQMINPPQSGFKESKAYRFNFIIK